MKIHARVTVNLLRLHYSLRVLLRIEYLGSKELSSLLGIDRRSAGRLLSMMERIGLAVRWSRTHYRLLPYTYVGVDSVGQDDESYGDGETVALSP